MTDTPRWRRNGPDPSERQPTRRGAALVVVFGFFLAVAPPAPVGADNSTTVAPYSTSEVYEYCGSGLAVCDVAVSADHQTGALALDVSVIGTKAVWFYCWPLCYFGWGDNGGGASAVVDSIQTLSKPATSITYTVVVDTGAVSTEAEVDGGAAVTLGARAYCWAMWSCGGHTYIELAHTDRQPSSDPMTRTLTLTMRDSYGEKIPAGNITVGVYLSGGGGGVGTSKASATATVKSISSTIQR